MEDEKEVNLYFYLFSPMDDYHGGFPKDFDIIIY